MKSIYIIDGVRTPMAKAGTDLKNLNASALGQLTTKHLLLKYPDLYELTDEVIFGCVAQPPDEMNIARVISLLSGLDKRIPAYTVHRNCASGMQSVTEAMEKILINRGNTFIVGGVESMSNIPLFFNKTTTEKLMSLFKAKTTKQKLSILRKFRLSDLKPVIGLEVGLTDYVCSLNMGLTAENLARKYGISRLEQDKFALMSHKKALKGKNNRKKEILPVYPPPDYKMIDNDNGVREDQTLEALQKLKPYFNRVSGTITVGNACQVTDGACSLVVGDDETVRRLNCEPLGRIVDYAYAGLAPDEMGLGPAFAIPLVLKKTGLSLDEFELIEINEAFAAQVIACNYALKSKDFAEKYFGDTQAYGEIPYEILNVNGGAIALGHPVGMTGSRLLLTLLTEMKRRNLKKGLAALCIGGGQGAAFVLESC